MGQYPWLPSHHWTVPSWLRASSLPTWTWPIRSTDSTTLQEDRVGLQGSKLREAPWQHPGAPGLFFSAGHNCPFLPSSLPRLINHLWSVWAQVLIPPPKKKYLIVLVKSSPTWNTPRIIAMYLRWWQCWAQLHGWGALPSSILSTSQSSSMNHSTSH